MKFKQIQEMFNFEFGAFFSLKFLLLICFALLMNGSRFKFVRADSNRVDINKANPELALSVRDQRLITQKPEIWFMYREQDNSPLYACSYVTPSLAARR